MNQTNIALLSLIFIVCDTFIFSLSILGQRNAPKNILGTVVLTTMLCCLSVYGQVKKDLVNTLSVQGKTSTISHDPMETSDNILKWRKISLAQGDQWVEGLLVKYPDGMTGPQISDEVRKGGYQDYSLGIGKQCSLGEGFSEADLISFSFGISNYIAFYKKNRYIFMPVVGISMQSLEDILTQYPELINIQNTVDGSNNSGSLWKFYFDNTKLSTQMGFSHTGLNAIFIAESDTFQGNLLNESASIIIGGLFSNPHDVFYVSDNFQISDSYDDNLKPKSIQAFFITELLCDLLCLEYYPEDSNSIDDILVKGFIYLIADSYGLDKEDAFKFFYNGDLNYILIGEYLAKYMREIYSLYGINQDYDSFIEKLSQSPMKNLIDEPLYRNEFGKLKNMILTHPTVLKNRAREKVGEFINNLIAIYKPKK